MKIKIAEPGVDKTGIADPGIGRFITPRIDSLAFALGGTQPDATAPPWGATSRPIARTRLLPRDSHRQASLAGVGLRRHGAAKPVIARLFPEHLIEIPWRFSIPSLSLHKWSGLISAGGHELEEYWRGHFALIDGKGGDVHRVGFIFVVRNRALRAAAKAECPPFPQDLCHPMGDRERAPNSVDVRAAPSYQGN